MIPSLKKFQHVILIDDDRIFNLLNRSLILKNGFVGAVYEFDNSKKAYNHIFKSKFLKKFGDDNVLILLDLNMPSLNGWDFLEKYKTLDESIKASFSVVILTSSVDPEDFEKSKTYSEVAGFEVKPLMMSSFQEYKKGLEAVL